MKINLLSSTKIFVFVVVDEKKTLMQIWSWPSPRSRSLGDDRQPCSGSFFWGTFVVYVFSDESYVSSLSRRRNGTNEDGRRLRLQQPPRRQHCIHVYCSIWLTISAHVFVRFLSLPSSLCRSYAIDCVSCVPFACVSPAELISLCRLTYHHNISTFRRVSVSDGRTAF